MSQVPTSIRAKLDQFFTPYPAKEFPAGQVILAAGQPVHTITYLKTGTVKQYAISPDGHELVANTFKPPAFWPINYALHPADDHPYYFQAVSAVTAHQAPIQDVRAFLHQHPDVTFNLLERVYRGIDGMQQRLLYLQSGNKQANVITELLIAAKRFGQAKSDGSYELTINQQDIANQSGMARETVSREMQKLKHKGLVTTRHQVIVIPDLQKLEHELN